MGVNFEPYLINRCYLCGSAEKLTGEHKFKASLLRETFGHTAVGISRFDGLVRPRYPQSLKSKLFHFNTPLCQKCNNAHTQPADVAFHHFHKKVSDLVNAGREPADIFLEKLYEKGSSEYLNVFRYFSKLLCGHIAESEGPRFLELCDFAIGKHSNNYIYLNVVVNYLSELVGTGEALRQFFSHSGLGVYLDPDSGRINEFVTGLTIGQISYCFGVLFYSDISIELEQEHVAFSNKCHYSHKK